MNSLKGNDEVKLIILVCGDSKTGKKTIVNQIMGDKKSEPKDHGNYSSYEFNYEFVGKSKISIPVEIRILNSEELETELKSNKPFFSDALGAFVVTSITDNNSFVNGEKWKDKIDLMCCLPNRFPLPVFLLINKYDEYLNDQEQYKNLQYIQKDKIESYALSNQFFNTFLIVKNSDNENINNKNIDLKNIGKEENLIKEQNIINNDKKDIDSVVEAEVAFQELTKIIMGFRDIKNVFISQAGGVIENNDLDGQNNKQNKKCIIY
jgi:GTPase SAR1 family protein